MREVLNYNSVIFNMLILSRRIIDFFDIFKTLK
jgi:hypothetical protein